MEASRRKFFGIAAVSPFAAKKAVEETAMQLVQGSALGRGYAGECASVPTGPSRTPKDFARAFLDPKFRSAMEAAAFNNNRHVTYIEHDIASKRSFSLAAKITFQRQRNVERELSSYVAEPQYYWQIIENYFNPFGMT